jgi:MFS family permease
VRSLFAAAPSAVVGAFVVGLVNGPVVAITPVFGVSIGMSQDRAAALLFALQAGSLLMQWPLGWLSDRTDRRYVIAGLAAGTSFVSLLVLLAFGCWGGLALCIYTVCVAHACDIVDPGEIISTVGTLLFSWATGVTIGPLLGAMAMEVIGPNGLFIYAALASLALAAFIFARITQVARSPSMGGFAAVAPAVSNSAALAPQAEAGAAEIQPHHEPLAGNKAGSQDQKDGSAVREETSS